MGVDRRCPEYPNARLAVLGGSGHACFLPFAGANAPLRSARRVRSLSPPPTFHRLRRWSLEVGSATLAHGCLSLRDVDPVGCARLRPCAPPVGRAKIGFLRQAQGRLRAASARRLVTGVNPVTRRSCRLRRTPSGVSRSLRHKLPIASQSLPYARARNRCPTAPDPAYLMGLFSSGQERPSTAIRTNGG